MKINLSTLNNPFNLDDVAEDDSVDEIIANNILEKIPPDQILGVITGWVHKLRTNGKLLLTTIDIRRVGLMAWKGEYGLDSIDAAIFGRDRNNKCVVDTKMAKACVEKCGLKVNTISVQNAIISLEAIKR